MPSRSGMPPRRSPAGQAEAWMRLGRWRSSKSAKKEIAEIYAARTLGRPVKLRGPAPGGRCS